MPQRTSKKKIVFLILDHERRALVLAAGSTRLAALTTYLTEECGASGDALKEKLATIDDLNCWDIQQITPLITKAKYRPVRLLGL